MAVGTYGVYLLLGFGQRDRLLQIVAVIAVFLLMAIHTSQAEKINMLLVVECHHRSGLVWRIVNLFIGNCNDGVRNPHDIGGVFARRMQEIFIGRTVANDTLGIVAPFAMAAEALTVIGALESRLPEIGRVGLAAMALAA